MDTIREVMLRETKYDSRFDIVKARVDKFTQDLSVFDGSLTAKLDQALNASGDARQAFQVEAGQMVETLKSKKDVLKDAEILEPQPLGPRADRLADDRGPSTPSPCSSAG